MTTLKLLAALPQEHNSNGLDDKIAERMHADPTELHVVVMLLDCRKSEIDHDAGGIIAKARIRRAEPITLSEDREKAALLLRRAMESRTGQTVLPIDMEDDLRAILGDDPDSR